MDSGLLTLFEPVRDLVLLILAGIGVAMLANLLWQSVFRKHAPAADHIGTLPNASSPAPDQRARPLERGHWTLNTGAYWTNDVQPLARHVAGLLDHKAYIYLVAPRLSDFLSVDKRFEGDQRGVAMETRLRSHRAALAILDAKTGVPVAALLNASHNNEIPMGAFEALRLPYVVLDKITLANVKEALASMRIGLVDTGKKRKRPAAMSTQKQMPVPIERPAEEPPSHPEPPVHSEHPAGPDSPPNSAPSTDSEPERRPAIANCTSLAPIRKP